MSTISTHPSWRSAYRAVLPAAAIGLVALAGCSSSGGSGGGSHSSSAAAAAGSSGMTVTVHDASGHAGALAASNGRTLYVSDQEHGSVLCKSSACTAIWLPLTVPAGTTPSGPGQLKGELSTMARPDGKSQVTLNGQPLYMFSFDHKAGATGGDGQRDSFDGTSFTWHVATAAGGSTAPATPAPSSAYNSGGGSGYHY